MNYRHLYHAGGFADVIKHVFLTALILHLNKKPAAYCYIDTHAGPGFYDLFSEFAKKNKEYELGIEKIIHEDAPPPIVKDYLHCIHAINNRLTHSAFSSLRYYPGSPLLVRHFLRAHDRIVACELQPQEYERLRETFLADKQVSVQHMDGFLSLKAFLPPKSGRGLIFIDPPYENTDEFVHIAHTLPSALKRFTQGVYAIWFPIKESAAVTRFYRSLKELIDRPMLALELTIFPDLPQHMNGCGLVIINPPYQLQETTEQLLPWLWKSLTINEQGGYKTISLK